jgi:hypothetical protein
VKHQRFVGTGYFDMVANTISSGAASTVALRGSTEEAQFADLKRPEQMIAVGEDPSCRPILGDCPLVDRSTQTTDSIQ